MAKASETRRRYADFKEELSGREFAISLRDGNVIRGRVVEVRPYWIKVVTSEGTTLYINKAYIALIRPA